MRRLALTLAAAAAWCAATTLVQAQEKFSGSQTCAKPDTQTALPAGDNPNHTFGVEQFKCTWTTPIAFGGAKAQDGAATETTEARGDMVAFHGLYVATLEGGDKVYMPYRGNGSLKDGKPVQSQGGFILVGGSGKLKGITGKGSFTCTAAGDGGLNCTAEGEYTLAANAPATAPAAPPGGGAAGAPAVAKPVPAAPPTPATK